MSAYWSQWSHVEIMSMHGIEEDEDIDFCDFDQENDVDTELCQRCSGSGCNYCLMVNW